MRGTNFQVMRAYIDQTDAEGHNASGRVFFRDSKLYSYGSHYPLAIRQTDGTYLLNIDRYSVTTSKHRSTFISAFCASQDRKGLKYDVDWQWGDVVVYSNTLGMQRIA